VRELLIFFKSDPELPNDISVSFEGKLMSDPEKIRQFYSFRVADGLY
jgi:hypothetical protein